MIVFSPEPLPVLTRSVVVLKKIVNDAFDVVEFVVFRLAYCVLGYWSSGSISENKEKAEN